MTNKIKNSNTLSRSHFNRTVRALRREMDALRADSKRRIREAYAAGFDDGGEDEPGLTFAGKSIRRGYRSMRVTVRDETSTSQEAAIERSYRQYATNPLAWAIANVRTDYVWGNGPTLTADHEDVQAVLDRHWFDGINDWEGKGAQRVRDLGLYGELVLEAFVRYDGVLGDGRVRLGAIDAAEIDQIVTDPENREEIVAIRLKAIAGERQNAGRLLKVIAEDEASGRLAGVRHETFAAGREYEADQIVRREGRRWRVSEANKPTDRFASGWSNIRVTECCYGRAWRVSEAAGGIMYQDTTGQEINGLPYDGQCFIVQVNKTSIGLRGRPDGLALIDWLDRYDQMFFDILEHAALLKDIVWDLLVNNADETEVNKKVQGFVASVARAGKVFGHNQDVALTPQNPDLKGADWASLSDTVLNLIAGGARTPVYMLGSGGDANLATATAQGSPTYRGFETRQGIVRRLLERILTYVIDCSVEARRLPEWIEMLNENGEPQVDKRGNPIRIRAREAFAVQMPEISPKDTAAAANVFTAVANAVSTLFLARLMPVQTAVEFIARAAELLGVEIDIEKVVETLSEMGAPDTSGLADALDKAQAGQFAPSGNGQGGKDDVASLLAAMNEGAREEPKGNGRTGETSMQQMQQFHEMIREYELRMSAMLARAEDSRQSDEIRRVLESIRLAQAESQSRPIEPQPAPVVNVSINPTEMTIEPKAINQPAPIINVAAPIMPVPVMNVEVPVGPFVDALNRATQAGELKDVQFAKVIEALSRIKEAAAAGNVQPIINISVPEQPPPVVMTTINVPEQPAPHVTVEVPEQKPVTKRIIRDRRGDITEIREEPEG